MVLHLPSSAVSYYVKSSVFVLSLCCLCNKILISSLLCRTVWYIAVHRIVSFPFIAPLKWHFYKNRDFQLARFSASFSAFISLSFRREYLEGLVMRVQTSEYIFCTVYTVYAYCCMFLCECMCLYSAIHGHVCATVFVPHVSPGLL